MDRKLTGLSYEDFQEIISSSQMWKLTISKYDILFK